MTHISTSISRILIKSLSTHAEKTFHPIAPLHLRLILSILEHIRSQKPYCRK